MTKFIIGVNDQKRLLIQLGDTGETQLLPHENTYKCYNGYEWNIEREKEWNTITGR